MTFLDVLKSKIDDSIDEMPMDYENSSSFTSEEVEHESRDGFIPYTDGGYQAVWFEYLSGMWGAGRSLPTKQLYDEMNRQIDYNLDSAKDSFVDEYPEIVEELGLENIDYNSLYEAGYGEEAETLSSSEMEMMGEDTIMMQVSAFYYSPENSRAVDGKHTIRLFGDVNLESPYHRAGNLDDSYEFEFTFDSIDVLETEMAIGIAKILSWFNGDMYNDSDAEMKVRRMEEGGSVKGIKKKAEKLLEDSINYRFKNTDMGSGWLFQLESPLNKNVFNLLEEQLYLDEFSPDDMGIEDYDDLSKEEQDYYYEDWKEELFQSSFEAFKEKCKKHLDDFIEYIQQAKEYQDEMNEYSKGGEVYKLILGNEVTEYDNLDELIDDYEDKYTTSEKKKVEIVYGSDLIKPKGQTEIKYAKGGKVGLTSEEEEIIDERIEYYFDNEDYTDDIDELASFVIEGGEIDGDKYEVIKKYILQNKYAKGGEAGDIVEVELNNGKLIKGKIEKTNPFKIRTDSTSVQTIPNALIKSINKIEEEFSEGGEIQDWMEEALASLIEQTGNEGLDITMVSNGGNEFFAGNDMEEYRVFKSEDDAELTAEDEVREMLEDSPENFNQDFIINYIDGDSFFEDSLDEMNRSYAEDITSETDKKYANRLIAEMVENGLLDEDDALSDDGEELAEERIEDLVNLMTEEQMNQGNKGFDYFVDNFGQEETMQMVIKNNLIDIYRASKDAVTEDGIGHFLSSYDGETLYLSDGYVAYRNN